MQKEASVKLSARKLAFALATQELKSGMHTLLVQEKINALASIQQEKHKAEMEMLTISFASKAARDKKAREDLERQHSLKRTVDMRNRYIEIGDSPLSATAKAKFAEKILLEK